MVLATLDPPMMAANFWITVASGPYTDGLGLPQVADCLRVRGVSPKERLRACRVGVAAQGSDPAVGRVARGVR